MILSSETYMRPPADAQDYLDGRNLAENIYYIIIQVLQVADDEGKQRRKGTRSLGYAVVCSYSLRGADELPTRARHLVSWAGTPDAAQEFDAAGCPLCGVDRRNPWR